MKPVISVEAVSKIYDGFKALDAVDLQIGRGEIFALLGPNGAGKTTLISIICGTVSLASGRVLVEGRDVRDDFRETRRRIGLVPQEIALDIFATVWSTVSFSRALFGKPASELGWHAPLAPRLAPLIDAPGDESKRDLAANVTSSLAANPAVLVAAECRRAVAALRWTVFLAQQDGATADFSATLSKLDTLATLTDLVQSYQLARMLGHGPEHAADPTPGGRLQASFAELQALLGSQGKRLADLAFVLQGNKSDLPDAVNTEHLAALLGVASLPAYATSAVTGSGVFNALRDVSRRLFAWLKERNVSDYDASAVAQSWAEQINRECAGRCEIEVPVPGSPAQSQTMLYQPRPGVSAQSVLTVQSWCVRGAKREVIHRANVTV